MKTPKGYLLEGITIIVSLILAFMAEEYRDGIKDEAEEKKALLAIHHELISNWNLILEADSLNRVVATNYAIASHYSDDKGNLWIDSAKVRHWNSKYSFRGTFGIEVDDGNYWYSFFLPVKTFKWKIINRGIYDGVMQSLVAERIDIEFLGLLQTIYGQQSLKGIEKEQDEYMDNITNTVYDTDDGILFNKEQYKLLRLNTQTLMLYYVITIDEWEEPLKKFNSLMHDKGYLESEFELRDWRAVKANIVPEELYR